jgi:hypothetical protein
MRVRMLPLVLAIAPMIGGCHPSDESLIAAFERDRTEFERLLTMVRQDSQLESIHDTWYRDQEGNNHNAPERGLLSAERWAEYRRLIHALDLEGGVSQVVGVLHDDRYYAVYFERDCHGLFASCKGLAFVSHPLGKYEICRLDTNCRPLCAGADSEGTCYRRITGKWYVYLYTASPR